MTQPAEPARVFRLRVSKDYSSSASGGDSKLYASVDQLRSDLLNAYLDVISSPDERGQRPPRYWFARRWRTHRRGDDDLYPRVRRILSVEQLFDGAWVEITPEFVDPDVQLRGIR